MAYARFSKDCDVYIFERDDIPKDKPLVCCGCKLTNKEIYYNKDEMIKHLQEHINEGHKIPNIIFTRVQYS